MGLGPHGVKWARRAKVLTPNEGLLRLCSNFNTRGHSYVAMPPLRILSLTRDSRRILKPKICEKYPSGDIHLESFVWVRVQVEINGWNLRAKFMELET